MMMSSVMYQKSNLIIIIRLFNGLKMDILETGDVKGQLAKYVGDGGGTSQNPTHFFARQSDIATK
jgi:hypothetical protein